MSRFVQLHVLTSYPPSNLNRDDTGRPKSVVIGNVPRLRVSSQSLKRAWRTSDLFEQALGADHVAGIRTKTMGERIYNDLVHNDVSEKNAREWARAIAGQFGKLKDSKEKKAADKAKSKKPAAQNDLALEESASDLSKPTQRQANEDLYVEQLVHFSAEEQAAIAQLVATLSARKSAPTEDELNLLTQSRQSVDIALFGRMLARSPQFNTDAAVQVAHAFTVHPSVEETDYFTAVDDLSNSNEDRGAAHIGELGFGAGVFYTYVCVDRELLEHNLGAEQDPVLARERANRALEGLVQAMTKVAPTGKQNSFASRAYASYVLAERGDQQPRSLAQSFVKPIRTQNGQVVDDVIGAAIQALETQLQRLDGVYGPCADARAALSAHDSPRTQEAVSTMSLPSLINFVQTVPSSTPSKQAG